MMTIPQHLQGYQNYAEDFLPILDSVASTSFPAWVPTQLSELLEQIQTYAQKTIAQCNAPVKIGVMGEFNAGKTLLLSSLFGFAGALPISKFPTTGNVTAIHLVQQPELATTQFSPYTISYLKHEEIKKHLRSMVQETAELAAESSHLSDAAKSLKQAVESASTLNIDQLLERCKTLWTAKRAELRSRLYEVILLLRAYKAYGSTLCGQSYQVSATTVEQGLRLPLPPDNLLELEFEQLPRSPQAWKDPSHPTAIDLQQSFTLIRQIDVRVSVSKEVWDLSALKGTNEFILLDFPGLNAGSSRMRDRLLSREAIEDVQTVLVLVNGSNPGNETAAKIRTMLEVRKGENLEDRIIVVVSQFNRLPFSQDEKATLQTLIEQEKVSEEMVLDHLKILKYPMASANSLTPQKKKIVLVSQPHGLAYLKKTLSLDVCSPALQSELNLERLNQENEPLELWKQLSDRLPSSSMLKHQLNAYVEDGGLGRLRALLSDHVSQHGMKQLLEDTQSSVRALRQAHTKLNLLLKELPEYIPTAEDPNFFKLRDEIETLIKVYEQAQKALSQQPILKNRYGVPVNEVVKDELRHRIFAWNEWGTLFKKAENGVIKVQSETSIFGDLEDSIFEEDDEEDIIPLSSNDFYPVFEAMLEQMQTFAQDCTKQAVIDWFREFTYQIEPIRHQINQLSSPEFEQIQGYDRKQQDLLKALQRTLNPERWRSIIVEKSQLEIQQATDAAQCFPLALANQKHHHEVGQIFAWNPNKHYLEEDPLPFNHLMMVIRVRDAIITSAEAYLSQQMSTLIKQVQSVLSKALNESIKKTQELLQPANEPLLKLLTSAQSSSSHVSPIWLGILNKIPAIPAPQSSQDD